jgi:copper(I)-binding protein
MFRPILICLAAIALCAGPARAQSAGALKIGHAWVRPTPPGAANAAGYLSVTNHGAAPDRLIGGASPEVQRIEVHEMSMTGQVMRMRPVKGGLVIAPGQTVELAPGAGYHLMLIGPKHPFRLGEKFPATLQFEKAGTVNVTFQVQQAAEKSAPPMQPMGGMDMR